MTLVASGGMKTSMPATLIIRILPVNDEMPVLVNNTGLEVWAGATSPITNRHLGKINYLFLGSAPHYNLRALFLGQLNNINKRTFLTKNFWREK